MLHHPSRPNKLAWDPIRLVFSEGAGIIKLCLQGSQTIPKECNGNVNVNIMAHSLVIYARYVLNTRFWTQEFAVHTLQEHPPAHEPTVSGVCRGGALGPHPCAPERRLRAAHGGVRALTHVRRQRLQRHDSGAAVRSCLQRRRLGPAPHAQPYNQKTTF